MAVQPIVKAWLAPCAMFTGAAGVIDRTPDRPAIALKVRLVAPAGPELVTVNVTFVAPPPIGSTRFTGAPAAGFDEYCGSGAGGGRPIVKFGAVQTCVPGVQLIPTAGGTDPFDGIAVTGYWGATAPAGIANTTLQASVGVVGSVAPAGEPKRMIL